MLLRTSRLLLVVFVVGLVLSGGCILAGRVERVTGSGYVVTDTRALEGISEVILTSVGDVEIEVGEAESAVIEAEDNLLPLITTEVSNGVLSIGMKDGVDIGPTLPIRYWVTVGRVDRAEISGAGNLTVRTQGAERLELSIPGTGDITAAGSADLLTVLLTGAGNVDASRLQSTDATVEVSGTGNAVVWAVRTLQARLSGVGNISYWGSPALEESVTGVGKVLALGVK